MSASLLPSKHQFPFSLLVRLESSTLSHFSFRFNAALSGEPERTIVTSTGPFIVAWNFRQVKSGNISNYTLRRFSEDVVADNFKFGGDRDIVSSGCSYSVAPRAVLMPFLNPTDCHLTGECFHRTEERSQRCVPFATFTLERWLTSLATYVAPSRDSIANVVRTWEG